MFNPLHFLTALDLETTLLTVSFVLGVLFMLFGLDDLFIDLVAWFKGLKPNQVSSEQRKKMDSLPQKSLAVIVPCWQEDGIIQKMLEANAERVDYDNYKLFVGVYPNDPLTIAEVEAAAAKYPDKVQAVVNFKNGPTSKGQILNYVVKQVLEMGENPGERSFDAFHMQDSEDLMHPDILKLVNYQLEDYDFIQTPVYSFPLKFKHMVAGIYIDEFSESHTKDILVRNDLDAAVPSAGVGTCFNRKVVENLIENHGSLFNPNSLTEDYELGLNSHYAGFKSKFACDYNESEDGERDFIATREYFPKGFHHSVKQKTRWTIGISLQGLRNIGWRGTMANRYFLLRDRKAIWINLAVIVGYLGFFALIAFLLAYGRFPEYQNPTLETAFSFVLTVNIILMANRLFQRMFSVYRVYGSSAAMPVILRWPLSCVVNGFASISAIYKTLMSKWTNRKIAWAKTKHESPV